MLVDLAKHAVPVPSRATCFLCGMEFSSEELGQEHVFPKWLQGRFNLWDRTLILLNGTRIPYRNLKIPACGPCNTIFLSRIEAEVASASKGGAATVKELGHETLYLWMAKMYFGTLYAEALLPINRANHDQGSILESNALDGFRFMHLMMQAARSEIAFESDETRFHSSILVFRLQEHPEASQRFMYRDDVNYGCIAVRLNTVGILCVTDGGAQEKLADEILPRLLEHNLHPLQFEEITAKVFMKARSFTRTPKFLSTHVGGKAKFFQMPLGGSSENPLFGDYDHEEYARMLSMFTDHPMSLTWPGDGSVVTWIRDYAQPHFIDLNEHPWP